RLSGARYDRACGKRSSPSPSERRVSGNLGGHARFGFAAKPEGLDVHADRGKLVGEDEAGRRPEGRTHRDYPRADGVVAPAPSNSTITLAESGVAAAPNASRTSSKA